jgi:hypothetical protein
MAGKLFSRALMSLFMDKSAREKYEAIQEVKRRDEAAKSGKPMPAQATTPEPDDDILPETLVRKAIDEAAAELDRKKNLPADRRALIEQALAIQDSKRQLLNDLPQEQREKLIVMAMHAFGTEADARAAKKSQKTPQKTPKKKS